MSTKLRGDAFEAALQFEEFMSRASFSSSANCAKKNAHSHKSRLIDHVLVQRRWSSSILNMKVLNLPIPSDHKAVVSDVRVKWRVEKKQNELIPYLLVP